jgi:hypothetical protein
MNIDILGTVVDDVYLGYYSCYSIYKKGEKILRTQSTNISASYMYDLSVYDSDKIDDIVFDYTYDNEYVCDELTIEEIQEASNKIPKLKLFLRNKIICGLIGGE